MPHAEPARFRARTDEEFLRLIARIGDTATPVEELRELALQSARRLMAINSYLGACRSGEGEATSTELDTRSMAQRGTWAPVRKAQ